MLSSLVPEDPLTWWKPITRLLVTLTISADRMNVTQGLDRAAATTAAVRVSSMLI
jgi:hypothetical protein